MSAPIVIGSPEDFARAIAVRPDPNDLTHAQQAERSGVAPSPDAANDWTRKITPEPAPMPKPFVAPEPTSDPVGDWQAALAKSERDRAAAPYIPYFVDAKPLPVPPLLEGPANA